MKMINGLDKRQGHQLAVIRQQWEEKTALIAAPKPRKLSHRLTRIFTDQTK
jgi:hypothetical protein